MDFQLTNCYGFSNRANMEELLVSLEGNKIFSVLGLNNIQIFENQPYGPNLEECLVSFIKATPSMHSVSLVDYRISQKASVEIFGCPLFGHDSNFQYSASNCGIKSGAFELYVQDE
jgi:hypothetical protein